VHLVGFIIKKFVRMQHGHMDVKDIPCIESEVQSFDILTVLDIQITVLWHVLSCRLVDRHWTVRCDIVQDHKHTEIKKPQTITVH